MKKNNSKSQEAQSHSQRSQKEQSKDKRKTASYTQGDQIPEDVDEILSSINLTKPRSAYNFFFQEFFEKSKETLSFGNAAKKASEKWSSVSANDKKKFEKKAEEDLIRYQESLELARKYVLKKPLKEGATPYRIYLDECISEAIEKNEDVKQVQKVAAANWKDMTKEERGAYKEKGRQHQEFYDELHKNRNKASAFNLYIKENKIKGTNKEKSLTMQELADQWGRLKQSVKDKFEQWADEINEEREKQRDIYEMAFGIRPRKPIGAYKFFMMEKAKEGKFKGKNPMVEAKRLWEKTSEEEKERFQRISQREKLTYQLKKMDFNSSVRKSIPKAATAFNIFAQDLKEQNKIDSSAYEQGKIFEYLNKKWNKLDETTKGKYKNLAEKSKEESFKAREEAKSRVYDFPKRTANLYALYVAETIPKLKAKNPKKSVAELMKVAAANWAELTDKDKKPFLKEYEKGKLAYEKSLKDFEENGYYTSAKKEVKRAPAKSRSQSAAKTGKRQKKTAD